MSLINAQHMDIHQKISMPDNQKLKTMVKRSIDQKLRLRNFDDRNESIETGAVVTNRDGQRGVQRGQGQCYQCKATRGDKCSFRHDEDERAQPTPKTAPPSEPPTQRGGSASRKKNVRGRSPSGKFARQPCRDFLKGICTKSLCDYWRRSERQFYNSASGCVTSARLHTGRLKVNQQKKTKKGW